MLFGGDPSCRLVALSLKKIRMYDHPNFIRPGPGSGATDLQLVVSHANIFKTL